MFKLIRNKFQEVPYQTGTTVYSTHNNGINWRIEWDQFKTLTLIGNLGHGIEIIEEAWPIKSNEQIEKKAFELFSNKQKTRSKGNNQNFPILVYEHRPITWSKWKTYITPSYMPETSVFRAYWDGSRKIEVVEGVPEEEGGYSNGIISKQKHFRNNLGGFSALVENNISNEIDNRRAPGGVVSDYLAFKAINSCISYVFFGLVALGFLVSIIKYAL